MKRDIPPHNGASANPYYPERPVKPAPEPLTEEMKIQKALARIEAAKKKEEAK